MRITYTPGMNIVTVTAQAIARRGAVEIVDPTGRLREIAGDGFPNAVRDTLVKILGREFSMSASDVLDAVFDLPRFYPNFRRRKGSVFVDMRAGMVDARKTIPDFKSGAYFRRFVR